MKKYNITEISVNCDGIRATKTLGIKDNWYSSTLEGSIRSRYQVGLGLADYLDDTLIQIEKFLLLDDQ